MRTTLSIEDDALKLARELAERTGMSLGRAVSEFVRRGASRPLTTRERHGLQVVELPADSPAVTSEHVDRRADR